MDLSRAVSRLIGAAALVLAAATAAAAQCTPTTTPALIGPGTPCVACWTNPHTNTDGSPLTELLTTVHVYVDPPASGPVIGVTFPAIVAPIPNGVAGAPTSLPLCPHFGGMTPSSGAHTMAVSVLTATAESPGGPTPPLPFQFQAIGPGRGAGVGYR